MPAHIEEVTKTNIFMFTISTLLTEKTLTVLCQIQQRQ